MLLKEQPNHSSPSKGVHLSNLSQKTLHACTQVECKERGGRDHEKEMKRKEKKERKEGRKNGAKQSRKHWLVGWFVGCACSERHSNQTLSCKL